jgi:FixJ family two-component response regulator
MPEPTVLIIDDDLQLRASLERLLRSVGLDAQQFASISDFLEADLPNAPTCLVLDVRFPERSGLDLQRELTAANIQLPIVFITGYGDIPMSVQAMKGGAIEFLTKPFREQDLLEAIQLGLARDRARRESEKSVRDLRERFEGLSPREREIMIQVVQGRLSKQIAFEIGISETTVKAHRSHLMRKMKAGSLPELGRMADKLHLLAEGPTPPLQIKRSTVVRGVEPSARAVAAFHAPAALLWVALSSPIKAKIPRGRRRFVAAASKP